MRIEYNRQACSGWFNCVKWWDEFSMDIESGKAEFARAEEVEEGVFVREVPEDQEEYAREAAESCPVDAIEIIEDD